MNPESENNNIDFMTIINQDAISFLQNGIVKLMNVIEWGKAMATVNEFIQKDILKYIGLEVYDPERDDNCPEISIANNSPGFDLIIKNQYGEIKRIQSKLRQVKGKTDFSQQTHFETTRRNSVKNKGTVSETGHVAYGCNEFDYVMISLVNVGKNGEIRTNRNNINNWSFSLVPVVELINEEKNCCATSISANILEKYKFDPKNKIEVQQKFPQIF